MDYPMRRDDPFHPPPDYTRLRAELPVSRVRLRNGQQVWFVTRQADAKVVLGDPAFSSVPSAPGYPAIRPLPEGPPPPGVFLAMDAPEHTRLRRMLTGEFTVKRMAALSPVIDKVIADCLAELTAVDGPVDLVEVFARPAPSLVICELLGVPHSDRLFFNERSQVQLDRAAPASAVAQAVEDLRAYLDGLVRLKTARPGDDLLSRLVVQRVRTGELAHEELVGIARLLLVAGHETTANMIALSVLTLLTQRSHWRELCADPALVPGAVEELLRFSSIVQQGVARAVVADVSVGGQAMRPGDGVLVALASADRDENVFPDPDTLDLHRPAGRHIAFGFGVHQCLGQMLARAELVAALTALTRAVPDLRLAIDVADVEFRPDMAVYGISTLPVTT
ncbi:cytochrome P450 [Allokutzneria sp. A3M-2-11 16]|uniref:cytochrome P450 n=1 Tax=Allokutzneria sp. A3M-2-11 16 TaxID=2962043 RepID=UPI0020B75E3F|nr:cytochrome P450 [Allokutzneria sp. A3M-2-11 16]MCP3800180.1 cytochrome P450 [Allokutzneria sp. A3M-2-11 16]